MDSNTEFYRHLFDCSNFGIIGTDREGIIISWNQTAERLFQADTESMIGQHIEQIVPEHRRELLRRMIDRVVSRKQQTEFEVDYPGQADHGLSLGVYISPILDDEQKILGLAAWVRDITRRKNLEKQLLEAEKMVSLGTLASGVAHHFNNIIGGVATFVDFALHSNNPQASRRALQMTAEAAGRIGQITQSLLTFAEQDTRQFDLADLTEVVMTFTHLVEKPLTEKNIQIELVLKSVPVFEVPGSRMHQVLGNLLDNSENAMPSGGVVTITLEHQGEDIILRFADTGEGIPDEDLPHIFEPFFTTRGTISGGNQSSAGLGLSVVHGIVHELGGSITVCSDHGKGTTFTMRFPQKNVKPMKPAPDKIDRPVY